ncbi:hypothetical protein K7711_03245 [Nocardia sp. CA2R105]|uniref:hypothetical protein n=1 Tax=Nocardia coffeae TaxID=2873381 RepID=UPI001CA6B5B0|nr:hypothetical protein [Nocardia coffeae]MBY8855484.1 hypothetical protein [Nocardia coffeae]
MDQENGPKPELFSHSTVAVPTPANATAEAKAQRPIFSSAPAAPPTAPADQDR